MFFYGSRETPKAAAVIYNYRIIVLHPTVLALSIHNSINSQNCFLRGLETIILRIKLPILDITCIYCTVWTSMLGEAMLQVACGSSNLQN